MKWTKPSLVEPSADLRSPTYRRPGAAEELVAPRPPERAPRSAGESRVLELAEGAAPSARSAGSEVRAS